MARPSPEEELLAILKIVQRHPRGTSLGAIRMELGIPIPRSTLQFRLHGLVAAGRLSLEGAGRGARYVLPGRREASAAAADTSRQSAEEAVVPLSEASSTIRHYLAQPPIARKPVGYNREFLDSYRPNTTFYLAAAERAHLAEIGRSNVLTEAAGTYAKQLLSRLLIDLSWNSSRLEGNTYSLLDTKRLIEFGQEAQGRDRLEAQMIVNHKEAIEFLVRGANEIGFNRYTILNLHGILAQNLLPNTEVAGRLRHIGIGIERSTFQPLAMPQLIEECFNQLLATATAIEDPFEQAFFLMVQLPYLQPFDDVNKRVSRLSANIPFIQRNLSPLSFIDLPRSLYIEAILGVYELNRVELLKDVFLWGYARSAEQYAAVRQSLGEPDAFRLQHTAALRQVVSGVVRGQMGRQKAMAYIARWAGENISEDERDRFREMAEHELLSLHEGNFARHHIRPSEFASWREIWAGKLMG